MQQSPDISAPEPAPSDLARWADWFSPGRFAVLLGLLVFAAFPQVILGTQTFVIRDYGFFVHPLASFQRDCFWHGQLPFWDPYNNCGVPFLAQWNTMPLYPPVLLYLLLPLTWALSFFSLAHLWFAGLGMYWLTRRWTGNSFAAAFAGVIFSFNGISLNLLMWPSHIATLSWMPWVILTVEQAWREGGRKIALAAFAGALQMLAGGPETILFTWSLLALLWLLHLAGTLRTGRAAAWRFPLVVLLIAGLAAVQLLPFLDLTAHSQRQTGYADTRWSMPGRGWVNFLVPMAFGQVSKVGVFFQYNQLWTSSYYLGVGTLLLALLAVWLCLSKKIKPIGTLSRSAIWLFIAVAVIALICALGDQTFFYRDLRRLVPQLSFMTYPIKYVTLVVFIAPVLAALALARLVPASRERNCSGRGPVISIGIFLLALIAVVLFWAWQSPLPGDNVSATLVNGLTRAGFLAAICGLLMPLVRNSPTPPMRWVPLVLILVSWLDVLTHEPTQNPTVPPWVYQRDLARGKLAMQPQPALGQSRAMVSAAAETTFIRVATTLRDDFLIKRLGYFADCNILDGVPKVDGFFSLYPRECGELNSVLYESTNTINCPGLLDFMGVSQITAPGQFVQWQSRDTALPLVTAGQRPAYLDDSNAVLAIIQPNFNSRQWVVLPDHTSQVTVTNQTRARVLGSHVTNERVDAEVNADEPSLVVIAQTYYPAWHACVDGNPVPLLRANYAFQALQVPEGTHKVSVIYEDKPFRIGVIISALTLLGCAVSLALQPGRKRNEVAAGVRRLKN